MTPAEIDRDLAVLAVLGKEIARRDSELRDLRRATIRPGQRSPVALSDDEPEIAWVSMTKPSKGSVTAKVVDLDALVAWCREHRPGALTETVRTSDQAAILAEVKATGEVIPGTEICEPTIGTGQLRVNVEDGSFERLLLAVQDGRVDTLKALGGAA